MGDVLLPRDGPHDTRERDAMIDAGLLERPTLRPPTELLHAPPVATFGGPAAPGELPTGPPPVGVADARAGTPVHPPRPAGDATFGGSGAGSAAPPSAATFSGSAGQGPKMTAAPSVVELSEEEKAAADFAQGLPPPHTGSTSDPLVS